MKLIIEIDEDDYTMCQILTKEMCDTRMKLTDNLKYAISNGIPLDKIRTEILEEKECAYADFDKYKVDYLGVDSRYVEDELPYDDFRYGMERCIEIIDKYKAESEEG